MTWPCLSRTVARTLTTFTFTEMVETGVVSEFVSPVSTEAAEAFFTSPLDCAAAFTRPKVSTTHTIQVAPNCIGRIKGFIRIREQSRSGLIQSEHNQRGMVVASGVKICKVSQSGRRRPIQFPLRPFFAHFAVKNLLPRFG